MVEVQGTAPGRNNTSTKIAVGVLVGALVVAALVVFLSSRSGVTTAPPTNSVLAAQLASACQSDAKTVGIAVAALQAENPRAAPATSAQWKSALLGTSLVGGPFLQQWPGDPTYYTVSVAVRGAPTTNDAAAGGESAAPTAPQAGDVLVTTTLSKSRSGAPNVYDATLYPVEACEHF